MSNETQEKLIAAIAKYGGTAPSGSEVFMELLSPRKRESFWWWDNVDEIIRNSWDHLSLDAKLVAMLWGAREARANFNALDYDFLD